jgi:hypothetical protein
MRAMAEEPDTAAAPPAPAPAAEPAAVDPAEAEARAWAEVQARWDDQAAHLAYLARFPDLDGLAAAGRRYRDALAARPGDAVALAMKAEVLKRATAVGLAMLPRTAPPRAASPGWRRALLFLAAAWVVLAAGWLAWQLFTGPVL